MGTKAKIYFFPNGNTAVMVKGEQSSKHQRSWLLKYVEFLEGQGIDVLNSEYVMPDGEKVQLIKIKRGYNWRFLHENIVNK